MPAMRASLFLSSFFMAERRATSPAKKIFRVWAEDVQLVYQDIEADNPMEAIEIAEHERDDWELTTADSVISSTARAMRGSGLSRA